MELKFRVFAHLSAPVHEVFEAVADPAQLSCYFTTGGAKGRMAEGATVSWDFADFPGQGGRSRARQAHPAPMGSQRTG